MKYTVKLLPDAFKDLIEVKNWYNNQRKGLGKDFKNEIIKEFAYISKYPEHYQIKFKHLRQSLVKRFPYAIFYSIDKKNKTIVIFAVLYTGRNPNILSSRVKKKHNE